MKSYAKMEGVLIHPVCATITMTVETTVMNLDAVRLFCAFLVEWMQHKQNMFVFFNIKQSCNRLFKH